MQHNLVTVRFYFWKFCPLIIFLIGFVCSVYSAIIKREVADGSQWVVDIKNGKKVECQGVQVSLEKILTLSECVNTK